jgi:hypothetical protein
LDECDGAAYKNTRMTERTKFEGFGAKEEVFWPEKGENRAVPVTEKVTGIKTKVFILDELQNVLH